MDLSPKLLLGGQKSKTFLGGKYQFTYFDVYVAYLTSPCIFLPNGKNVNIFGEKPVGEKLLLLDGVHIYSGEHF